MDYYRLLNIITNIGFQLLSSGAETYRVEESLERMLCAYNLQEVDVFVIPNCIIVTIRLPNNKSLTKTKRVKSRVVNLDQIDLINSLVRKISETSPSIEEIEQSVLELRCDGRQSPIKQFIGHGLVAFGFTLMYGGTRMDAIASMLIGLVIYFVVFIASKYQVNSIFRTMVASAITAILALILVHIGLGSHMDKMIIGAFMNLVPGVIMTNGIRDIIVGDFVSGQVRLTEALLIATAMAVGVGLILSIAL